LNKKDKVNEIKKRVGERFNGRCEICHIEWSPRGMTFHHISYKDTDKKHSDFGKGYDGMLDYYVYLEPLILAEPERFAYLCNTHHQVITRFLRFSVDKQDRIFDLIKRSRY